MLYITGDQLPTSRANNHDTDQRSTSSANNYDTDQPPTSIANNHDTVFKERCNTSEDMCLRQKDIDNTSRDVRSVLNRPKNKNPGRELGISILIC